ncbi:MAG: hypothetical protein F6J90_13700 [Moorea sp. SIOASIH]|uniref:hypothetical protein n=1 Tax=Moorena sp. SIOASIH TaxID=2607817 RepID=UPI0013B6DE06|nr:hypothetical protein [Moorena sp. SIOASIH]NEO37320.1 hypothetical protein [Moorena sp. SIOASIH]
MTTTRNYLEQIGRLEIQVPNKVVEVDPNFLSQSDPDMSRYWSLFKENVGRFSWHYHATVPFITEESMRLGMTMCKFAEWLSVQRNDNIKYYEISGADAVHGRTMAEYSNGLIRTLTDSPDLANKEDFYRLLKHNYSKLYHGSFVDITPEYLASEPELEWFKDGFDIVHMWMTLQFYCSDRDTQIFYIKKVLKEDGIILFKEKLLIPDQEQYQRNEDNKDKLFKSLYFSEEVIESKRLNALVKGKGLGVGQVDFETCVTAIKKHFKFVYLIWNCGNFYELAASDNELMISKFLEILPPPYMPDPFSTEKDLPRQL